MNKELQKYLEYEAQILNSIAPCVSLLAKAAEENNEILNKVIVSKRSNESICDYIIKLNKCVQSLEKLHSLPLNIAENEKEENDIYYKIMNK